MRILHFFWSLEWEAVTHERSGSWDAGTLWYSSSPGGSLAAELGRVADRDAELSLAQSAFGVMGAVRRDAEL